MYTFLLQLVINLHSTMSVKSLYTGVAFSSFLAEHLYLPSSSNCTLRIMSSVPKFLSGLALSGKSPLRRVHVTLGVGLKRNNYNNKSSHQKSQINRNLLPVSQSTWTPCSISTLERKFKTWWLEMNTDYLLSSEDAFHELDPSLNCNGSFFWCPHNLGCSVCWCCYGNKKRGQEKNHNVPQEWHLSWRNSCQKTIFARIYMYLFDSLTWHQVLFII